ncbi:uncharacterized protein LOC129107328 [Anoplopoma fimbria]|uniref:uncharacterized protein LOC129107328 n=1 Tax=Anoplopoma fimbria TaxID=229290 RepID=UPI0023EBAFEF|nr:uncharacterized protein LOC129107328 [Anoplopoma fimbria]
MAGIVHVVMRLLLLSFITTGVNAGDGLIFTERAYDLTVPCEDDLVCFHIWKLSRRLLSDYVAIVSNGAIQTATSEDKDSKCTLQIKDLTAEDVGRHRCPKRPDVSSRTSPELNLMPGKTVTLQCILLSFLQNRHCYKALQVGLAWVDEAGAEIQEDSQHQIKQESPCNVILTVAFQSPPNRKFRCRATVGKQVQTSVELLVRVPALKGKGRGIVIDLKPGNQGGNRDTIGAAVGVVGCVVLAGLVALFVVNRRRRRSQLQDESCYTTSTNNVLNADDVVYADIMLPIDPDRVWVHEYESTEYACVQYK